MINFKYWTFSAKIIDNRQYPKAPVVEETVRNEIHRPVLIYSYRFVHDHPEVADALLAFLQSQRETFFTVKTFGALVVNQVAFPAQKSMQSGRAELTQPFGKFT